ncbi:MAG: hypothetical protein ACLSVD_17980 [Eggerthellaceae bacterium]
MGHCAINCPGRCSLKFHVQDDEVAWVETYTSRTPASTRFSRAPACAVARIAAGSPTPIASTTP